MFPNVKTLACSVQGVDSVSNNTHTYIHIHTHTLSQTHTHTCIYKCMHTHLDKHTQVL